MECRRKTGCTSYPLNDHVAGPRMDGGRGLLEEPAADGPRALEWPALRRDPHGVRLAKLQHAEGLAVALVGEPPPVDAANCCNVAALVRHSGPSGGLRAPVVADSAQMQAPPDS